jgi:hypothetical protein
MNLNYIVSYERVIWDLGLNKFDFINRLIPLSVIPLSGTHCNLICMYSYAKLLIIKCTLLNGLMDNVFS